MDEAKIDACIKDSFEDGEEKKDNTILHVQRKLFGESSADLFPSITINDQPFRGEHDAEQVFLAICASFKVPE